MSWGLPRGCDLVLELHLRSTGTVPEQVKAEIGFYFAETVPTTIPSVVRLGREDIDIPAGSSDHVVLDSYVLPVDVEVHSVQAHAHHLAREIRSFAVLPDGTTKWLLYIDRWDFDWQDVYRYAQPFWLPRGTTVKMEFTYDNTERNPANQYSPPQRIRFGQRAQDEMAFMWLQVVTRTPEARTILTEETWRKNVNEDIAGMKSMLDVNPASARVHADLAYLYLRLDDVPSAEAHWREAIQLDSSLPGPHYDLGTMLLGQWRLEEAEAHLLEATRLEPDHSEAQNNLGTARLQLGKRSEAIADFRQAIKVKPSNGEAHYNLGKQLDELHEFEEASRHYEEALRHGLDDRDVNVSLASSLARQRRFSEAVPYYEKAIRYDPDLVPALVDLAWILVGADAGHQDPARAIQLAEHARAVAERDGQLDPVILEALAMAYASDSRFEDAIAAARFGLKLIGSAGREALAAALRLRIEEWTKAISSVRR
jgi:tetratricopeptide (TPR) repeat protein